jgi:monoamine oxidase
MFSRSLLDCPAPQDENYGGFGGPHCMVVGGYSRLLEGLAAGLDVRLGTVVRNVEYSEAGVTVTTAAGDKLAGAAAIITVPLGVLKSGRCADCAV